MKNLKKEPNKSKFEDEFISWLSIPEIDLIWNWIQENYVPKDKVRGLKMKKRGKTKFSCQMNTWDYKPENELIDKFNNSIDEVLK